MSTGSSRRRGAPASGSPRTCVAPPGSTASPTAAAPAARRRIGGGGLAAGTFPLVRDLVPRVLGVDEPQLAGAMAWLARTHQQLAEPSGVAALAAALDPRSGLAGARVGVLLTGRNVALRRFLDLVAPHADEPR